MKRKPDVLIIGGGIAGASVAYHLGDKASVTILEGESQPGVHSTGRSAAFFAELYGGRGVQPLSAASKSFLFDPPPGFADGPLVAERGALHVSAPDADAELDALEAAYRDAGVAIEAFGPEATVAAAALLAPGWNRRSLWEPGCKDIDVARLHQGFLSGSRKRGGRIHCDARVEAVKRHGARLRAITAAGAFDADVVVNAAGAWADDIAQMAGVRMIGIQPMRRTMVVADIGEPPPPDLPVIFDTSGELYFKPDAGLVWISPHDETPCPASDAQPEELAIAIAVDRFERVTTAKVRRVARAWAGLRNFAPDRMPVIGFDPDAPGFFWCAGQGGFGIQTSPAAGALAAALILGTDLPTGIEPGLYAPKRFA